MPLTKERFDWLREVAKRDRRRVQDTAALILEAWLDEHAQDLRPEITKGHTENQSTVSAAVEGGS